MFRQHGISIRFIGAMVALGLVVCAASVFTLISFGAVRNSYDRMSQETLPLISTAANLSQIAQAIASGAAGLISAEDENQRRVIQHGFHDQLRDLDSYLDGLLSQFVPSQPASREAVDRVREMQTLLAGNLEALDTAVRSHIQALDSLNQSIDTARAVMDSTLVLARSVDGEACADQIAGPVGPGPPLAEAIGQGPDPGTTPQDQQTTRAWIIQTQQLLNGFIGIGRLTNPALVRRDQGRLEPLIASVLATAPPASLPESEQALVTAIVADVEGLANPDTGIAAQALTRIVTDRRLRGLGGENSLVASRFLASVSTLTAILESELSAQELAISGLSDRTLFVLIGVAVFTAAAVIVLSIFLQRSVIARLFRLRDALRATVAGAQHPTTIPVEGHDEIHEIGAAARYFVKTIEDREHRLRLAKNAAEDLARQAESANRAKSVFLANMSHELRTPLNAIIGFSDLITDDPDTPQVSQDFASDINRSGRHLLSLINNLLDLSRIEAGRRSLVHRPVQAYAVMEDVRALIRFELQRNNLSLRNTIPMRATVDGDELAMRQILLNLVGNAVKFAYDGSVVTVSGDTRDGRLYVSVADCGIGIAEDQLAKVLEPFHQEASGLARAADGAGLGLAIVDSLVRLHGGVTTITSEKSVGTTVTVSFPLTVASGMPPAAAPRNASLQDRRAGAQTVQSAPQAARAKT